MAKLPVLDLIALIIVIIGGLNWGLVGMAHFDLVAWLSGAGPFGVQNALGSGVYALVGLAPLYQVVSLRMIRGRPGVRTA